MADFPGTTGDDNYAGTADPDLIFDGGGGSDSLGGAGGNDTISVSGGSDTVDGGANGSAFGDLLIVDYSAQAGAFVSSGGNLISNGAGVSVSYVGIERLQVIGGAGADTLVGGAAVQSILIGGAGDDRLESAVGTGVASINRLEGGLGADTLVGALNKDDYVVLRTLADSPDAAPDMVMGFEDSRDLIDVRPLALTSAAVVIVHQTPFRSVLLIDGGGDGAFETRVVFDTSVGGSVLFNDNANAGSTTIVIGDDSNQAMSAGGGNDVLAGNGGNDTITSNDGADTLFGGDGADRLTSGGGADLIYGGLGADTADGGTGDDRVFGEDANDQLDGGSGLDLLSGGEGEDRLDGGSDNDTLLGGGGDDELDGSSGNDVLVGGAGADLIEDFSTGADQIFGDAGADILIGSGGADTIFGGADNDRLYGDQDLTASVAESGADYLHGEDGSDTIEGGYGADVLFGGAGADTFLYTRSLSFSVRVLESTESAADFIGDFQSGVDRIDLSAVDADENFAGDQAFIFVTTATGQDQQATLTYDPMTNRTTFRGYVNDDLIADLVIVIAGNVTSDAANWVL